MPGQNKTYCQDESGNYGKTIWQYRWPSDSVLKDRSWKKFSVMRFTSRTWTNFMRFVKLIFTINLVLKFWRSNLVAATQYVTDVEMVDRTLLHNGDINLPLPWIYRKIPNYGPTPAATEAGDTLLSWKSNFLYLHLLAWVFQVVIYF